MDLPRPIIRYESTDLINLYCYILDEIVQQLQGDVPDNIKARLQDIQFCSQHFKDSYLTANQSIFDEDTFVETVSLLKESLDNIDKNTYYKDSDYWQLYEAIETFLYGELNPNQTDGDFWGIKGFSLLWEDMCHTFFFKENHKDVLYADTDISLKDHINEYRNDSEKNRVGNYSTHDGSKHWNRWVYRIISDIPYPNKNGCFGWNELLCIEMDLKPGKHVYTNERYNDLSERDRSKTKFRRFPRPDLILKSKRQRSKVMIIDYKYVPLSFYTNPNLSEKSNKKFREDIVKQLTYEFAIQQTHNVSTNRFFIPYFYINTPQPDPWGEIKDKLKYNGIRLEIDVFGLNFLLIQKIYLEENS